MKRDIIKAKVIGNYEDNVGLQEKDACLTFRNVMPRHQAYAPEYSLKRNALRAPHSIDVKRPSDSNPTVL